MKRTTVFIDETLLGRAKRYARGQGVSFATVVREALASYIAKPARPVSVPKIAGKFSSGFEDTSARADELLWRDPHA